MHSEGILYKRQSKRAYLPDAVPDDVLQRVMEGARWAPSCANKQPWRFCIARAPEALDRAQEALSRGNAWAKAAPVLIAVAARAEDGVTRADNGVTYYLFDCGLAVENLLLAAVEEGLMGHPMAGFNADRAKEAFAMPDEYDVICMISLGYPGDISLLDEQTRAKDERPRTRKPLSETVFYDRWPASA